MDEARDASGVVDAVARVAREVAAVTGHAARGVQDHAEFAAHIAVSSAFLTFAAYLEDHADALTASTQKGDS